MRFHLVSRFLLVPAGLLAAAILLAQEAQPVLAPGDSSSPVPTQARSPSYGTTNLTYARVTGLEFFPPMSTGGWATNNLGHYPVNTNSLYAPLHVPAGSIIERLEIDFCDSLDPEDIFLTLRECPPFGSCLAVVAQINSFAFPGCSQISTNGINYTVDDDGLFRLEAVFGAVNNPSLVLMGALVGYRLQVSPPPATATFNDVPTNHPFFQFIEALYASGITAGCGSGNFCPDGPLTRGQMAVFLAKALGL